MGGFKRSLLVAVVLFTSKSFALEKANCYHFTMDSAALTADVVEPGQETWCYQGLGSGRTFIYNADQENLRAELSAIVSADGVVTHGSLLAGRLSVHRAPAKEFNPLPVPLSEPVSFVSLRTATPIVSDDSATRVLKVLQSTPAVELPDLRIREGEFDEGVANSDLPWRGYWWPYHNQPLSGTTSSPLAKYDRYVRAETGASPAAASWENSRHRYKGISWEGHCNGWAASAIIRPQPRFTRRSPTGIAFTVVDQKGILAEKDYCVNTAFYGTRNRGRGNSSDIFPDLFHKVLTYYIGQLHKPVAMDYHASGSVDNHIISGYKMNIAKTGASTYTVRAELQVHKYDSARIQKPDIAPIYTRIYRYTLSVDASGNVTGGRWLTANPDFLWVPLSPTNCSGNNPRLDEAMVEKIMSLPEADSSRLASAQFVSESAIASVCPSLQGNYLCKLDDKDQKLSVLQRTENGASIFKVAFQGLSEEFIADGQARKIVRDGENLTYVSSCPQASDVLASVASRAGGFDTKTDILIRQQPSLDLALTIDLSTVIGNETLSSHQEASCRRQ